MTADGSKRRKLAHHSSDDESQPAASSRRAQKDFFKQASSWNLEQDYESRPRKGKKNSKESSRLPQIRSSNGRVEIVDVEAEEEAASVQSDTEWLEGREDDVESVPDEEEPDEEEPQVPEAQQILEAQEELARLAGAVNESPEENVGALKSIAAIGRSKIPTIQMLALMTQLTVYKDLIPGYRIRLHTDDSSSSKEKLSKEVRQLRQFEQSLVSGYQAYVQELARCAKFETKPLPTGQSVASVAVTCACTLATVVPHFNFRADVLKILVGKLSRRRIDDDAVNAQKALETLFRDDEEGRPSLEAVSLLTRMMKAREFEVDETTLNLFLSLRLLSEFAGKASQDSVERSGQGQAKPKKSKREFRTKKERKALKEQKALEKDMAQADALVSHEERDRMQSETLKLVFATYFRILKLRTPHLMGAVLEGLAKYAHLINQDFFGDLLEALKDLIRHSDADADADVDGADDADADDAAPVRNLTREALLCTVTAYALLAGQDAHNSRHDLHLDLSFFTTHLFGSLLSLATAADLEKTRAGPSPAPSPAAPAAKINVQTTTVLLIRCLTAILLPAYNMRQVPPLRLAAFTKQLMSAALHLPDKSAQAVLALLADVANTHANKVSSLWNTEERRGDGSFNPASASVEGSNPFATTVWEGELLRKHFSPKVREGVQILEKSMSA